MEKVQAELLIMGDKYYTIDDLRYNQKVGIMLSKEKFEQFLALKDELVSDSRDYLFAVPLKTFNSKHCYYVNASYLLKMQIEYRRLFLNDFELNHSSLFDRNIEHMLTSRFYSEIEGSLNIENVPTTHRRIVEISKCETLTDKNDIIIKNMIKAVEFIIKEQPEFNKDNLRKLYIILSEDCLPDELKLKDGAYYRDDEVTIDGFKGADPSIVEECMDSLFAFANDPESLKVHYDLLPYICHYYVLYVHPYFDYNGRTARMVSFWLNYINKIPSAPHFMSEAINESKSGYYKALRNTRNTNNDLTYFLGYILETSIKFSFVYKNIEEMRKILSKTGDALTPAEWVYVKKILVHNPDNYFNYKLFLTYISATMSRQGALKILNNLNSYGILEKTKNKKGDTIFKLNQEFITYRYRD